MTQLRTTAEINITEWDNVDDVEAHGFKGPAPMIMTDDVEIHGLRGPAPNHGRPGRRRRLTGDLGGGPAGARPGHRGRQRCRPRCAFRRCSADAVHLHVEDDLGGVDAAGELTELLHAREAQGVIGGSGHLPGPRREGVPTVARGSLSNWLGRGPAGLFRPLR